jgi:hypothetical protein
MSIREQARQLAAQENISFEAARGRLRRFPFKKAWTRKPPSERFLAKRRAFINALKAVPCKDCGNSYPPCVMDFDHLSNKSFNISQKIWCSMEELTAEIAKCDVVCANCHRIRSFG